MRYAENVTEVNKVDGLFVAGRYCAEKLVLASGASTPPAVAGSSVVLQGGRPIGVSMLVKSTKRDAHYFMFDYCEPYGGTYGWVFSLGQGVFNVGLWLKPSMRKALWSEFDSFVDRRCHDWVGETYEVISQPRSFPFGVNSNWLNIPDGLIVVGDAKIGSNPLTGEGLSRAISSAITAFGLKRNNADA